MALDVLLLYIDTFTKRHKIMADFQRLKYCITRYNLPNYKISGELKSYNSFLMYPPLWTSLLAAMDDDIENTSIEMFELTTIQH